MNMHPKIKELLSSNNNIITTSQVVEHGFSRALLSKYEKNGLLERVRQGIYILPDSIHDDMYTLMLWSEKIIFSHDTALFLNGLSDRTPYIHSVTIPSNACLPKSISDECICYYMQPDLHVIGLISLKTTFGNTVRCYNAERTICDLLRSRNRLEEEFVISAMKNYVKSKSKNLNLLSEYADLFKVTNLLKHYMEVLL